MVCRMTADRRALFDFALLVFRQLEQQEQQKSRGRRDSGDGEEGGDDDDKAWEVLEQVADDDFVHVGHADAAGEQH